MTSLQLLWDRWRRKSSGRIERVIVLVLDGFDMVLAEQFSDDGLLHYLPLLVDLGARLPLHDRNGNDFEAMAGSLRAAGVKTAILAAADSTDDLDSICAADREQQDRLFALLDQRRAGVVIAVFDMLARIGQGTGQRRIDEDPLVLRDVHARMDEHVGKALSFVDEESALVVVIPSHSLPSTAGGATSHTEIFVSRALPASETRICDLPELILQLLKSPTEPS